MTRRHGPIQQLKEAKQLARDHGCFVLERGDTYLLYRVQPGGNVLIGRRKSCAGIRRLVCRATDFH